MLFPRKLMRFSLYYTFYQACLLWQFLRNSLNWQRSRTALAFSHKELGWNLEYSSDRRRNENVWQHFSKKVEKKVSWQSICTIHQLSQASYLKRNYQKCTTFSKEIVSTASAFNRPSECNNRIDQMYREIFTYSVWLSKSAKINFATPKIQFHQRNHFLSILCSLSGGALETRVECL